jgi:hypothetical protein
MSTGVRAGVKRECVYGMKEVKEMREVKEVKEVKEDEVALQWCE